MSTCRWCVARIRPRNCGADGGRPHWVDDGYGSRWCPSGQKPHEPMAGEPLVAAEERGYQRAIDALRDLDRRGRANATTKGVFDPDQYDAGADLAADHLESLRGTDGG